MLKHRLLVLDQQYAYIAIRFTVHFVLSYDSVIQELEASNLGMLYE